MFRHVVKVLLFSLFCFVITTAVAHGRSMVQLTGESGAIGRENGTNTETYGRFYNPRLIAHYDDGTIERLPTRYPNSIHPPDAIGRLIGLHLPPGGNGGYFRYANAPDTTITFTWNYGGQQTTTTLQLYGELQGIAVPSGTIGRNNSSPLDWHYVPQVIKTYTDGSILSGPIGPYPMGIRYSVLSEQEKFTKSSINDVSPRLIRINPGYGWVRSANSPDADIIFLWQLTEGKTCYTESTLKVRGQLSKIKVDPFEATLTPANNYITPMATIEYTDGSNHEGLAVGLHYSMDPEGYLNVNRPYGIFGTGQLPLEQTEKVMITWSMFDGVHQYAETTLTLLGQEDEELPDQHGEGQSSTAIVE